MSDSSIELVGLVALSAFPLSLLPSYTPDDRAYVKRRIDLVDRLRRPAFSTARRVSRLRRLEPDYFLILDSAYSSLSLSLLLYREMVRSHRFPPLPVAISFLRSHRDVIAARRMDIRASVSAK